MVCRSLYFWWHRRGHFFSLFHTSRELDRFPDALGPTCSTWNRHRDRTSSRCGKSRYPGDRWRLVARTVIWLLSRARLWCWTSEVRFESTAVQRSCRRCRAMLAYYGLLTVLTAQMRLAANLAIMGNNHTETHSLQRSDDHLSLSAWLVWLYDDPSNLGCFRLQTLHDEWVATSVRYQLQHICAKLCTNYSESLNLGSLNSILCIFLRVFTWWHVYLNFYMDIFQCLWRD